MGNLVYQGPPRIKVQEPRLGSRAQSAKHPHTHTLQPALVKETPTPGICPCRRHSAPVTSRNKVIHLNRQSLYHRWLIRGVAHWYIYNLISKKTKAKNISRLIPYKECLRFSIHICETHKLRNCREINKSKEMLKHIQCAQGKAIEQKMLEIRQNFRTETLTVRSVTE